MPAVTDAAPRSPGWPDRIPASSTRSYWTLSKAPPLEEHRRPPGALIGDARGDLGTGARDAAELSPRFSTERPIRTDVTGLSEVARQVSERSEKDVQRSEIITTPLAGIALVLVFGSIVAAGLPLAIGVIAVVGTLLALHAPRRRTECRSSR